MDNYEEFFFLAADGELDEAQQQALQRFLQQHPQLEAEFGELASLKLTTDETFVFEDKTSLLKTAPKRRVITIDNSWKALAAAASIGLLIWAGIRFSKPGAEGRNSVAVVSAGTGKPVFGTTDTIVKKSQSPIAQTASPASAAIHHLKKEHLKSALPVAPIIAVREQGQLPVLQPSRRNAVTDYQTSPDALVMAQMPASIDLQATPQEKPAKGGLRFAPENIAAVQLLKNAANTTLDRLNNSPYHLRDLALNIKVGGRTLSINF